jgi:hypothetical protein
MSAILHEIRRGRETVTFFPRQAVQIPLRKDTITAMSLFVLQSYGKSFYTQQSIGK